jgi:hypothetical protein
MNDLEFAAALESCTLPEDRFHHRDHIRLAWIYLRHYGDGAPERISETIRRYAAHLGKGDRFHVTITLAWMQLVRRAAAERPEENFEEMVARCPYLLEKTHLSRYYSPSLLDSERAKITFLPPDLRLFPA